MELLARYDEVLDRLAAELRVHYRQRLVASYSLCFVTSSFVRVCIKSAQRCPSCATKRYTR